MTMKDFDDFVENLRLLVKNEKLEIELDYLISCLKLEVENLTFYDVSTLVTLSITICSSLITKHPDYSVLASRLCVDDLHRKTEPRFSDVVNLIHNYKCKNTGENNIFLSQEFYDSVALHAKIIDSWIVPERDYTYSYVGLKTLMHSYLYKLENKIVERPQYMLMRVAVGIHCTLENSLWLNDAHNTYDLLSRGFFTHATPTLFNSGMRKAQLASCFLLDIKEDSLDGIYKTLHDCAQISKYAGGIGVSMHKIRAQNSFIAGTNGKSNGLLPLLRVYNSTTRYVDQGGGKRKGTIAVYLEPWHSDIFDVLDAKKNTGSEEQRTRDLFYALWIPDLFMKRVENNESWSLFCPAECPGLYEVTGEDFEKLYTKYEQENKARKVVSAQLLFTKIIHTQIETGSPYMLYKDTINKTCNQKHLGTIKSSNLCAEICQYTDKNEIAVCNLASICLPLFIKDEKFDHSLLYSVTSTIVQNLNKVIDKTYYPVHEARVSNLRHRPMGIGIQGLADVFAILNLAFDSEEACKLNREIVETIYFAALSESNNISKKDGPYDSFFGSPLSFGNFHFDLYKDSFSYSLLNGRWDWESLRKQIIISGVRNSLFVALMPTASTSQIMGNTDAFEPFSSNIYTRRLLSGEFVIINKHLVKDLLSLNLWNTELKDKLVEQNGSVQNLDIPDNLKQKYKTAFEISPKTIMKMAKDRQFFVDQSQSMNLFIDTPTVNQLANIHMYGWKHGLKTGMYYLRTKPVVNAVKVTLSPVNDDTCSSKNQNCFSCSS